MLSYAAARMTDHGGTDVGMVHNPVTVSHEGQALPASKIQKLGWTELQSGESDTGHTRCLLVMEGTAYHKSR